jgi:hypothetical protein
MFRHCGGLRALVRVQSVPANYSNFFGFNSTSDKNLNKNWEWVNDGTHDIKVFIDGQIEQILYDFEDRPKYGWLLESKTIIPDVYSWTEANIDTIAMFCKGVFTHDTELLSKSNFFLEAMPNAAPWVQDRDVHAKTKLISMIASDKSWAEGHRHRLTYVDKFRDKVDFYGRGFNTIENKEEALRDYMFSIAIENCAYDNYFTEKITDCFATGTVPIFYGSPQAVERYFDPRGIIYLTPDFDPTSVNEELYESMKDYVRYNFEVAVSFPTAEDYLVDRHLRSFL